MVERWLKGKHEGSIKHLYFLLGKSQGCLRVSLDVHYNFWCSIQGKKGGRIPLHCWFTPMLNPLPPTSFLPCSSPSLLSYTLSPLSSCPLLFLLLTYQAWRVAVVELTLEVLLVLLLLAQREQNGCWRSTLCVISSHFSTVEVAEVLSTVVMFPHPPISLILHRIGLLVTENTTQSWHDHNAIWCILKSTPYWVWWAWFLRTGLQSCFTIQIPTIVAACSHLSSM